MRMRPTPAVAVMAAIGVLCAATWVADAEISARVGVYRFLLDHPDWRLAGITVDPFAGRLRLRGLRARSGTTSLSIGMLNLPARRRGFGFIATAQAAASAKPGAPAPPPRPADLSISPPPPDNASADNVVVTSGSTTYTIGHIALTGTKITDAGLATLLDPKSAASIETRLKSLSAASIEIPEVVADDPTAGSMRHWSVTKILLANVADGKAGAGSAGGVKLEVTQGGETVKGTLGAMQGVGLDLPQIAHVFGVPRADDKEAVAPLGDSAAVEAIRLTNAGKGTSIVLASLKATAIKGRPLRADHGTAGASSDGKPTLFEDLRKSFEVDTFVAADLSAIHKDKATDSTLSASRLFLKEVRNGTGSGGLRDFAYKQPAFAMTVGTVDFGNLPAPPGADQSPTIKGMISAGAISVQTGARELAKAAPEGPLAFKVAHLAIAGDTSAPGAIPSDLAVAVDHLTFAVGSETDTARTLRDIGYPTVDLSVALASKYDAAKKVLEIDKLSLSGTGMGTLTLGLDLTNVGQAIVSQNADEAKAAALAVLVDRLAVQVDNAGFFEKALAWKAKNDGVDVGVERDSGIDYFSNALPASLGDSAKAKALGGAIAQFIATPQSLRIKASVKGALGLGAADLGLLGSPDALLDKLDVEAKANGKP